MFTRAEFEDACKGFVEKYDRLSKSDVRSKQLLDWCWNEHPVSGYGYLSRRSTMCFDVKHDRPLDDAVHDTDFTEEDTQSVEATQLSVIEVSEYVVYSATFQVPAFYFSMHDTSGSPLSLNDILRTPFFRRKPFPGAEQTTFALQTPHASAPLLSQGEHPTLGTPCWFFHPCETPKALAELAEEDSRGNSAPNLVRQLELWFLLIGNVAN